MSYRVEHVSVPGKGIQHVLVNGAGDMVELPSRYLKHLIAIGKSSYTQKAYAYGLKSFFTYLEEIDIECLDVTRQELAKYVGWLQNPTVTTNIINLKAPKPLRSAKTVNNYLAAVLSFYRYLFELGLYEDDLWGEGGYGHPERSSYKPFLYQFGYKPKGSGFSLYVKEPKKRIEKLSKEQVENLLTATNNSRDKFLVYLLFVSGLRIGEALSLFNEDLIFDHAKGHRIVLRDRGYLINGAKLKTGERTVFVDQRCMDLYDDYQYDALEDIDKDSDFLFVKLRGNNIGQPMTYSDVSALFRRLRDKTGIPVHPHLLRHTHATLFYQKTKDAKALQDRLGHSSIQTSMNMYVNLSEEELYEDWVRAEEEFRLEDGNA